MENKKIRININSYNLSNEIQSMCKELINRSLIHIYIPYIIILLEEYIYQYMSWYYWSWYFVCSNKKMLSSIYIYKQHKEKCRNNDNHNGNNNGNYVGLDDNNNIDDISHINLLERLYDSDKEKEGNCLDRFLAFAYLSTDSKDEKKDNKTDKLDVFVNKDGYFLYHDIANPFLQNRVQHEEKKEDRNGIG